MGEEKQKGEGGGKVEKNGEGTDHFLYKIVKSVPNIVELYVLLPRVSIKKNCLWRGCQVSQITGDTEASEKGRESSEV